MTSVTLPLPPTGNLYFRIWRGRAVTSSEARAYKVSAALAARAQGMKPIESGDVSVTLVVYRPAKRGDLDNRIKVLLDAMRGIAYSDDAQIRRIEATQHEDRARPRVEVTVRPMPAHGAGPDIQSASWKVSAR